MYKNIRNIKGLFDITNYILYKSFVILRENKINIFDLIKDNVLKEQKIIDNY